MTGVYAMKPNRGGEPRDLRDQVFSEEISRTYDPSIFDWDHKSNFNVMEGEMVISFHQARKEINLFSLAAKKIREVTEPDKNGHYWVQIGIAKQAIAIMVSIPGRGFKARVVSKTKNPILSISCADIFRKLNENVIGKKFVAEWDDMHKMLVAKFPKGVIAQ